jgi:hypothetical protein
MDGRAPIYHPSVLSGDHNPFEESIPQESRQRSKGNPGADEGTQWTFCLVGEQKGHCINLNGWPTARSAGGQPSSSLPLWLRQAAAALHGTQGIAQLPV